MANLKSQNADGKRNVIIWRWQGLFWWAFSKTYEDLPQNRLIRSCYDTGQQMFISKVIIH